MERSWKESEEMRLIRLKRTYCLLGRQMKKITSWLAFSFAGIVSLLVICLWMCGPSDQDRLVGAVVDGNYEAAQDLMEHGLSANFRLPYDVAYSQADDIYTAVGNRAQELISRFGYFIGIMGSGIKAGKGDTPLCIAVRNGDLKLVQVLLKHGADANLADSKGRMPLHWACYARHWELYALLTQYGADATIKDSSGTSSDTYRNRCQPQVAEPDRKHKTQDP